MYTKDILKKFAENEIKTDEKAVFLEVVNKINCIITENRTEIVMGGELKTALHAVHISAQIQKDLASNFMNYISDEDKIGFQQLSQTRPGLMK